MATSDLKRIDTHFEFGRNWQSFAAEVTADNIAEAQRGLAKLFPERELEGASFLDIGCGAGLSMLAARQLGATTVIGVDIDPASVAAAGGVLARHLPDGGWLTREASVFALSPANDGLYDVVHSWGVLHHTGDLWQAMEKAAALVKPNGLLAVALYRRTGLCPLWRAEKRLYVTAGPVARAAIRGLYKTLYLTGLVLTGRSPARYIRTYKSRRGMDWHHDVHDWLGGYPYESVAPAEVVQFLETHGFGLVRSFCAPAKAKGIFGTHCDEFVAMRR